MFSNSTGEQASVNQLQLLMHDAQLEPTLQFAAPSPPQGLNPKTIFLTGATGFLGGYLLAELLHTTNAQIYCLLRGTQPEEGQQRLQQRLQRCDLWQAAYAQRLIPVLGDLAQPHWGLSSAQFAALAEQVDVIYHSGAWVNSIYPYEKLRATNVEGTRTALHFAGHQRTKPLHFISTLAIYFDDTLQERTILHETDIPALEPSLRGGYKRSKWVADCMVRNAMARGLPAAIYRPARITGHSQSGILGDTNDLLTILLKGCILMGTYPDLSIDVPMVPIDYITRSVGYLSQQEASLGKAFHFFNAPAIAWDELWRILQSLGYHMQKISYDQWWRAVDERVAAADTRRLYATLQRLLKAPNNLFFTRPVFDQSQTLAGLAGSGISCPPIEESLIARYFAYFQRIGYLPTPEELSAKPAAVSLHEA